MTIEGRLSWENLNPFLELNINHIAMGSFDYDRTCVFPVNIMSLALQEDKISYIENLDGEQHIPVLTDHVYLQPCHLKLHHRLTSQYRFIALHFNLTFCHGIDVFYGSKKCLMRHDPAMVARFRQLMMEKDDLKAICAMKAEVMSLCASWWPSGLEQRILSVRKYESLFRYIYEYGNAELTVGALADRMGMRQDVFSRNFSRDMGKSPKEFLQDDLLKKISVRLAVPRTTIKEIAAELKFCSEFYMSQFFKRHTGMSPSEYQQKFRPR